MGDEMQTGVVPTVSRETVAAPAVSPVNGFELLPWVVQLNRVPDLAGEIGERIAQRERLWDIARGLGVKRRQLMRWLKADPERYSEYEAGLEAMADELAMDTLDTARDATIVDVSLAKLRIDAYWKFAGKADAGRWGDKVVAPQSANAGPANITVVFVDSVNGRPVLEGA